MKTFKLSYRPANAQAYVDRFKDQLAKKDDDLNGLAQLKAIMAQVNEKRGRFLVLFSGR